MRLRGKLRGTCGRWRPLRRARVRGGGLIQWGSSWRRERVCGRSGPGKNHRDAKTADSKELWKSVERSKAPPFAKRERWATRNLNLRDLAATRRNVESGNNPAKIARHVLLLRKTCASAHF